MQAAIKILIDQMAVNPEAFTKNTGKFSWVEREIRNRLNPTNRWVSRFAFVSDEDFDALVQAFGGLAAQQLDAEVVQAMLESEKVKEDRPSSSTMTQQDFDRIRREMENAKFAQQLPQSGFGLANARGEMRGLANQITTAAAGLFGKGGK